LSGRRFGLLQLFWNASFSPFSLCGNVPKPLPRSIW